MQASAALAAAGSRAAIEEIALETVIAMLPSNRGVRATLFRGDAAKMTIVAAAGDHADEIVGFEVELCPEVVARLVAGEVIDATHLTSRERAASRVPAKLGDLFSAPLFVQGELAGALMVTSDGRLPHAFEDSFRTLASQVALTLERVELTYDLRRSEERFRALVQNASDMITVVDLEGRILYQSPSVERILGYDTNGLENQSILHIVHPDDV
jgi:PAS domain-containing protein